MIARVQTWCWTTPKEGHADEENDDACRIHWVDEGGGCATLLIAVSDGATESVYSGLWARTLVARASPDWCDQTTLENALDAVRREFRPFGEAQDLPWYVREKFQTQGSQATLLCAAMRLTDAPGDWRLQALAAGDSCLILLRPQDGRYGYAPFPLTHSRDFDTAPRLVRDRQPNELGLLTTEAELREGDVLLVVTDAVGKWVLQCCESGLSHQVPALLLELTRCGAVAAPPSFATAEPAVIGGRSWRHLLWRPKSDARLTPARPAAVPPPDAPARGFAELVRDWRGQDRSPRLRNDDATLAVCVIGPSTSTLESHLDAALQLPTERLDLLMAANERR